MGKIIWKAIPVIFLVITSSFCFGQNTAEALIEHLEAYIKQHNIPGAMLSIVRADTTVFVGGIGYANIEKSEKVSDQHLFRQGSISKSFIALGLVKLLNSSSYDLNSPIKEIDYNIPFINEWEHSYPVRVSHLLEHTSGFEDFHLHAMYNSKDSVMPPAINMVEDHRQSLGVRWQPGTKKAYSNPNYVVAGHLIEVLAGSSFDEYIKESVLNQIGMESSGFYFKKPAHKIFAEGYQRKGTTLNPISFATINGSPAGDFCANAKDMATYLQFMLNRDTALFSKGVFERIEKPHTSLAAKKGLQFGYGLGNYSIWKNGYLFHGHGGEINGFAARYLYSIEADLGVAIAINRNGNANAVIDEILDHLLGVQNGAPKGRKTLTIPESLKNEFSGFYEFKSPKSKLLAFSDRMFAGLILDFQEDKLLTSTILGKPKDTLYYAGNNQFYFNDEGVSSAMLIATQGKPAFWINDNYTERESRIKRLIIFFGLLFSFLLMVIFFIYSFIWLLRNSIISEKRNPNNHLILFGAGACLILMLLGFGLTVEKPQTAMHVSFSSLLMYLSSYALVCLSLISIYRWSKLPDKKRFRIFYILTSIGAITISIYLWDIGFIGLKLWSY